MGISLCLFFYEPASLFIFKTLLLLTKLTVYYSLTNHDLVIKLEEVLSYTCQGKAHIKYSARYLKVEMIKNVNITSY